MDLAQYHSDPPKDIFAPKAGERRLSIGIIGAGIAGLSAAIGLTKSGHDVEVRTPFPCPAFDLRNLRRSYLFGYR